MRNKIYERLWSFNLSYQKQSPTLYIYRKALLPCSGLKIERVNAIIHVRLNFCLTAGNAFGVLGILL